VKRKSPGKGRIRIAGVTKGRPSPLVSKYGDASGERYGAAS
jgi:hypothetical protein